MPDFKSVLLGEFSTILPEEEEQEFAEYLRGINKPVLLKAASFLLGFSPTTSKFNSWRTLVKMWFRDENSEFANTVWNNCIKLETGGQKVSLLSPLASLLFFEFVFSLKDDETTQNEVESEKNLFRAYLTFLSASTKKESLSSEYLQTLEPSLQTPALILNLMFPQSDFVNYDMADLFVTQVIKSLILFQFLEQNPVGQELLKIFCQQFKIGHWREYFEKVIPLIQAHINHPTEGWTELNVPNNERFEENCEFLDTFSLEHIDEEMNVDFRQLRSFPLYKIAQGRYSIISAQFVVEKVYKGLYFKLREINELLSDNIKRKNFRTFYTSEFSEKFLLYKILGYIFEKTSYIRFTGQQIKVDGAPDYYIRNGNNLFLFENKDVLINADIKHSGYYEVLENELKKKLYFEEKDGKIAQKAVLQLINNVKKALTKENPFDQNYKSISLKIYPILVLHDASFNAPGLNVIINIWFRNELTKLAEEGLPIDKIKQLTIINVDTLILYADYLKAKKIALHDLLDEYTKYCQINKNQKFRDMEHAKEVFGRTMLAFSFFIDKFTDVGCKKIRFGLLNSLMKDIDLYAEANFSENRVVA